MAIDKETMIADLTTTIGYLGDAEVAQDNPTRSAYIAGEITAYYHVIQGLEDGDWEVS